MKRVAGALLPWLIAAMPFLGQPALAVEPVTGLPPQRIVSLLPSLTETVCALGACDRLVGTDRYSNWPEAVQALPKLGGGIDPNVEAIVALKPDLVLLAPSSRITARLDQLGVRNLALEPKDLASAREVIATVGSALHAGDAEAVWKAIDAKVEAAAQSLTPAQRAMRVYFEVNAGPYAAGESSFIGELLMRLGVGNIVPAALGPFPKLTPEFVVRADPDLIMVSALGAVGLEQRPGWSSIRAVRAGRICRFTAEQTDVLVRAGPRIGEAAQIMAKCLIEKGGA